MVKKILSLSLAAVMAVASFGLTVMAQTTFTYAGEEIASFTETVGSASAKHEAIANLTPWDGTTKTAITKGDGSAENPYEISNAAELAWFISQCNAGDMTLCAKLVSDINMAKEDGTKNNWRPFSLGTNAYADATSAGFKGVFDGQGHNIYNYYWTQNANSDRVGSAGFFRRIDGGSVKNINFIDVDLTLSSRSDGGVGFGSVVCGHMTNVNSLAENIYISGNVKVFEHGSSVYAMLKSYGGIVANLYSGTVRNCYSDVNVNLKSSSSQRNNYMNQDHSTSESVNYGVGGIVGLVHHTYSNPRATVANCGNGGTIFAPHNRRVGGVIGALTRYDDNGNTCIENLWNTGDITAYGDVAGICGWMRSAGKLETSVYNTGDITAVSPVDTYASGIANHGPGSKTRKAYSTGNVYLKNTGEANASGKYDFGNVDGGFNDKMALLYATDSASKVTSSANVYPTGADFMVDADTPKWAISYKGTDARVTGNVGVGMAPEAMTESAILDTVGAGFTADFGINGNLPILVSQKADITVNDTTYELAEGKSITVKLESAGYVALNVINIVEGNSAVLVVAPKNGEAYNKEVKGTGIVTLDTKGADEVTVSVSEGSRVLVTEPESLAVSALESAVIKATFESEESATIILALFNGDLLEKVQYVSDVQVNDGTISAEIDLADVDTEGCELCAYVWANGTLAPVNAEVEVLN